MINVNTLDEIGTEVPLEDANGSYETYESLEDAVLESADGVEIAVVRQRPYGILLTVDDELRREHPVIGDAHAVLWHSDNDPEDSTNGLRLANEADAAKLTRGSISAVASDVIEHYKKNPGDDANPAYTLYRSWLADHPD